MSHRGYLGHSAPRAEVRTFTFGGGILNGDIARIKLGSRTFSYTLGSNVAATEAAAMAAALTARVSADYPEFVGLTFAYVSGAGFTMTGQAGVAYPATTAIVSTGGTFVMSITTAAKGPYVLNDPDNWTGGAVPVNGDDIDFLYAGKHARYNLDALAAVAPASVRHLATAGEVGLPLINGDGYVEYRPRYLQLNGCASVSIGAPTDVGDSTTFNTLADGIKKSQWDFLAGAAVVNVASSGVSSEIGVPPVLLLGSSLTANVTRGKVGVAYFGGETATVVVNQSWVSDQDLDSEVILGSGCTLSTIKKTGGRLTVNSNVTTLTHSGGETIIAAGSPGTIDASETGAVRYRSASNISTQLTLTGPVLFDCTQDNRARTFAATKIRKGASFIDRRKTVTFTAPIVCECNPFTDCTIDLGTNISLQRS